MARSSFSSITNSCQRLRTSLLFVVSSFVLSLSNDISNLFWNLSESRDFGFPLVHSYSNFLFFCLLWLDVVKDILHRIVLSQGCNPLIRLKWRIILWNIHNIDKWKHFLWVHSALQPLLLLWIPLMSCIGSKLLLLTFS